MTKTNKQQIITIFSIGAGLLSAGFVLLILIFMPVVKEEWRYYRYQKQLIEAASASAEGAELTKEQKAIQEFRPVSTDFAIVIPKLGVNSKIIANVDPFNETEYREKLMKGVAHAKGSRLPNQQGTTFLFAHSTGSVLTVNRYNAIFYLLHKMEEGEMIWLFYKGDKYEYQVKEKKVADPDEVDYLSNKFSDQGLVLMTCTPAGTSLRRLLVLAERV